jgi:hypothetical protein
MTGLYSSPRWGLMADEQALRRPTFVEGARVPLADGQTWSLPGRQADQADPEYDAMLRLVFEAEDEAERLRSELALIVFLLSRNYQLTPDLYQELLDFPPGDPALVEMQRAVHALAIEQMGHLMPDEPAPDIEAPTTPSPRGNILGRLARLRSRWWLWLN